MKAFFKHDTFPYVIGLTVDTMYDDGAVDTKEIGAGKLYAPKNILIFLPDKTGDKAIDELENLQKLYRDAKTRLRREYMAKAREIAPFIPETLDWSKSD